MSLIRLKPMEKGDAIHRSFVYYYVTQVSFPKNLSALNQDSPSQYS